MRTRVRGRYLSPFLMAATSLAALSLTRAAAAEPAPNHCRLSRSPLLLAASLPAELECKFDQDGNGLDDAIEQELAKCFAPEIHFDSAENALRDDEPNALFSAIRTGPDEITIRYSVLWEKDGGFVLGAHGTTGVFSCGDEHAGDSQGLWVKIRFQAGASHWTAWPVEADRSEAFRGTHAVVYATAGKHHYKPRPFDGTFDVSGPGKCNDRANGAGAVRIVGESNGLGHVPAQTLLKFSDTSAIHLATNICARAQDSSRFVDLTDAFQAAELDNLGYPGRTYFSGFYEADSPLNQLHAAIPSDVDDDMRPEVYRLERTSIESFQRVLAPTDKCPFGRDEDDEDGDQVYGACDPEPSFRNQYVAGGSSEWPAFTESLASSSLAWFSATGFRPRGGFWDSDQDGYVEGEDLCPTVPGGGSLRDGVSNWNSWGETLQFQNEEGTRDVGFYYRGNICDPYPSTSVEWTEVGALKQDHACKTFPRYETGGTPELGLSVSVSAGRSANDPNRGEQDNRQYQVQAFRCACEDGSTSNCLERDTSPCFSQLLQPADVNAASGTSWRPVQRPACAKDIENYCRPLSLANHATEHITWAWESEYESYPGHFPAGSVVESPAYGSLPPFPLVGVARNAGSYVLWSGALEGGSFSTPPGLAFPQPSTARFPEPERTPAGASLLDVSGRQSRSLRSAFAPAQEVKGRYTRVLRSGNDCQLPTLIDPCAAAQCGWLQWWNWLVFPPSVERVGGGLIRDWTSDDAWFWQRRGSRLEDVYFASAATSALRVTMEEPGHWSEGVAGVSAAMNNGYSAPALMFIEETSEGARWALLDAVAQDQSTMQFTPSAEGALGTGVTNQARLISDPRGQGAVLIDPELGTLMAFDFVQRQWLAQELPNIELSALASSTLTLSGNRLYSLSAGGSDGWTVDVFSGATFAWSLPGIVRRDARLTPTLDGQGLLLSGGQDARGAHDDVWLIDLNGRDEPVPRLLVADSSSPNATHASRALLGYSYGGRLTSVGSGEDGLGLTTLAAGEHGWRATECLPSSLRDQAVVATSDLWVGAGAELSSIGGPANAAGLGSVRIGVQAQVGSVTSGGSISIGHGAQLAGDAVAEGNIESRGSVAGAVRDHIPVGLEGLGCFDVQFPANSLGQVRVLPGHSKTLPPGNYGKLSVLPRGKLYLSSGTYFFDVLESLPLSRLELDTSDGPVRIYVRREFKALGELQDSANGADKLLVGFLGTKKVTLVRPFAGTLIAPHATVALANWESGAFKGAFFADRLEVLPFTSVHFVPFQGEYLP